MITTEERNAMVEANMNLVYTIAHRMRLPGECLDDIEQVGAMGLMHAAERFDPARGLKFATYAGRCITGYILDHRGKTTETVRRPRRNPTREVAESLDATYSDGKAVLQPVAPDNPSECAADREIAEAVRRAMWALTPRERVTIHLRFGFRLPNSDDARVVMRRGHTRTADGKPGEERSASLGAVAEELEVSRSRAQQLEVSGLARLREVLELSGVRS